MATFKLAKNIFVHYFYTRKNKKIKQKNKKHGTGMQ